MPSKEAPEISVSKRRACDECRGRKLACTKDLDGCSRCVKEGIACHYSQQKPMGRPRKRQRDDDPNECTTYPTPPDQESQQITSESFQNYQDLSTRPFPDVTGQSGYSTVHAEIDGPHIPPNDGKAMWTFAPGGINQLIDYAGTSILEVDPSTRLNPIEPVQNIFDGQGIGLNAGIGTEEEVPQCSCLARIYLAMASLQEFPSEIEPALKTVRSAAKTARDAVRCPKCGTCLLDFPIPPIGAFQNTMLLGTILPIVVNGYKRLLSMVDKEADEAQAAGKNVFFQMEAYGGMIEDDGLNCGCASAGSYNNVELPPLEWRTIVRALLRVDVYGHEMGYMGLPGSSTGLRGIITEIDDRQKERHARLDGLRDSGQLDDEAMQLLGPGGTPLAQSEIHSGCGRGSWEERNTFCRQVLSAAKRALDSLVIA